MANLISKKKTSNNVGVLAPAGEENPLVIKEKREEAKEGTCNPVKGTEQDAMTGFESLGRNKRTSI